MRNERHVGMNARMHFDLMVYSCHENVEELVWAALSKFNLCLLLIVCTNNLTDHDQ